MMAPVSVLKLIRMADSSMTTMLDNIDMPLINPFCASWIQLPSDVCILNLKAEAVIRLSVLTTDMGRVLLGS